MLGKAGEEEKEKESKNNNNVPPISDETLCGVFSGDKGERL